VLDPATITAQFIKKFNAHPKLFRAPGRVNLIGEHTDYNDGFVMPAAIEFATVIAAAPREDRRLVIASSGFGETEFDLSQPNNRIAEHHWSDYIVGTAVTLEKAGYHLKGANLLVESDVPSGAGLSSSAAVEVATALALRGISSLSLSKIEVIKICQHAENEFVGMRCGIMDQFISTLGKAAYALMIDCRTLDFTAVPLPAEVRLVICNSMVKHQHAGGKYNQRRLECEAGVKHFAQFKPGISALRDVSLEEFSRYKNGLSEIIARRCRHVISENERVGLAASALTENKVATFGQLMNQSHFSMRDDYEISCREIDALVEIAQSTEGVYGARMTGGGFGSCTINLVNADFIEDFCRKLREQYKNSTGIDCEIYVTSASDGATVL
jgi:galactokinase